jgi:hypothetical protein
MPDDARRGTLIAAAVLVLLSVVGFVFRSAVVDAWEWVTGDAADTVEGWATEFQDIAAELPEREVEVRSVVTDSQSALLVIGDGPGSSAFAIVAVAPEGDATFTLVPQRLLATVPGYGEFRLDEALAFEDAELAALTIMNRFGVRIDDVVAFAPGEMEQAIGTQLVVDVPVALFTQGPEGTQRVVAAGEQLVPPDLMETMLVSQGAGDGFEWLQRQGAVWRAVLDAVIDAPDLADRIAATAPRTAIVADLLLAVAASERLQLATIPVEAASGAGGESVFVPSQGAADFVDQRFDHLMLRDVRPPVEVLNGNGRIGATRVVAGNLVRLGFRVVRTDNADRFDYETSEVIAQGRKGEAAAREVLNALGTGTLLLELRAPSTVVDVSIIVGQDIPAGEG